MSKRKVIIISIIFLGLISITCLLLFYYSPFNYFFPPLKPNYLPIKYPDGTLLGPDYGKITRYEINAPINNLLSFFDRKLGDDPKNDLRHWFRRKIDENSFLYECDSAASTYFGERGCIYLKGLPDKTKVDSVWSYYPDNAPPCSYFLTELIK